MSPGPTSDIEDFLPNLRPYLLVTRTTTAGISSHEDEDGKEAKGDEEKAAMLMDDEEEMHVPRGKAQGKGKKAKKDDSTDDVEYGRTC